MLETAQLIQGSTCLQISKLMQHGAHVVSESALQSMIGLHTASRSQTTTMRDPWPTIVSTTFMRQACQYPTQYYTQIVKR